MFNSVTFEVKPLAVFSGRSDGEKILSSILQGFNCSKKYLLATALVVPGPEIGYSYDISFETGFDGNDYPSPTQLFFTTVKIYSTVDDDQPIPPVKESRYYYTTYQQAVAGHNKLVEHEMKKLPLSPHPNAE